MALGDTPSVLALSNGMGDPKRDDIVGIYLDAEGHFREHIKISNLVDPSEADREALTELLKRRRPQVVVVGGFSPNARQLWNQFVEFSKPISAELVNDEVDQPDDDERRTQDDLEKRALFETNFVYDEVARIYSNSQRAALEFPDFGKVGKYCVGLARYAQSPLNEYAALGSDLSALTFDSYQKFVSCHGPPEEHRRG
jgi:transcription elongation factor SPT6